MSKQIPAAIHPGISCAPEIPCSTRYGSSMNRPVGFWLSDEDIAVLDALVAAGEAADHTTALKQTLSRERQRQAAEHDALIYAANDPDPELDGLVKWNSLRIDLY